MLTNFKAANLIQADLSNTNRNAQWFEIVKERFARHR